MRTSLFSLSWHAKGERNSLRQVTVCTSNLTDLYAYRRPFRNPPVLEKRDPRVRFFVRVYFRSRRLKDTEITYDENTEIRRAFNQLADLYVRGIFNISDVTRHFITTFSINFLVIF